MIQNLISCEKTDAKSTTKKFWLKIRCVLKISELDFSFSQKFFQGNFSGANQSILMLYTAGKKYLFDLNLATAGRTWKSKSRLFAFQYESNCCWMRDNLPQQLLKKCTAKILSNQRCVSKSNGMKTVDHALHLKSCAVSLTSSNKKNWKDSKTLNVIEKVHNILKG